MIRGIKAAVRWQQSVALVEASVSPQSLVTDDGSMLGSGSPGANAYAAALRGAMRRQVVAGVSLI
jgi:hypothetical protein